MVLTLVFFDKYRVAHRVAPVYSYGSTACSLSLYITQPTHVFTPAGSAPFPQAPRAHVRKIAYVLTPARCAKGHSHHSVLKRFSQQSSSFCCILDCEHPNLCVSKYTLCETFIGSKIVPHVIGRQFVVDPAAKQSSRVSACVSVCARLVRV